MGTWDASVFGNDTAADWAGELVDADSEDLVVQALSHAANRSVTDYLDADEGAEALAAAEVVAAAAGRPIAANAYNEELLEWAANHPGLSRLRSLAFEAAQRVRMPESELLELWQEDGVDPVSRRAWEDSIIDLMNRLSG